MAEVAKATCMICAVQLWEWAPHYTPQEQEPADFNPYKWREEHIFLSGPTWPCDEKGPESLETPEQSVMVHKGRAYNRGSVILSDGREVSLQLEGLTEQHPDHDPSRGHRWYLGIHSTCLDMAKRVMSEPNGKIRSMSDLWMTIERRCVKTADENILPLYLPNIPDNRSGESTELGLRRYYIPREAICTEESILDQPSLEWWNFDPLNIPCLTDALISNLERVDVATTDQKFITNFNNLPREIEDIIVSLLRDANMSLECTYHIPQSHWKETLLQVPFLWDIEKMVIEKKDQEGMSGGFEWNWEKLVRQVMSEVSVPEKKNEIDPDDEEYDEEVEDAWNYQKVGLNVPPGLTNRRRIWQVLVEMYPNDVGMEHFINNMAE
ncbi:hypothetical protein FBEOM_2559 [Fusarium beomiforme]|uniref:Uncharacterized protein n=1 Tax=Fusarium beomiforme TaxID=44412 RepID=A0A9P5ARC4_9HYPO|nr:hypothetical protein FBEOM_2559 [Fusarium beomiforme]